MKLPEADEATVERLKARFAFQYPNKHLTHLPAKLSVSQLLREKRQEEAPELFPRRLMDFERGILTSGAEKIGTATHQVMQFCDFANIKHNGINFRQLLNKL